MDNTNNIINNFINDMNLEYDFFCYIQENLNNFNKIKNVNIATENNLFKQFKREDRLDYINNYLSKLNENDNFENDFLDFTLNYFIQEMFSRIDINNFAKKFNLIILSKYLKNNNSLKEFSIDCNLENLNKNINKKFNKILNFHINHYLNKLYENDIDLDKNDSSTNNTENINN
jgi:hypothetical protein